MTPSNLDLEGSDNNLKKVMLGKFINNSYQSDSDKLPTWLPAHNQATNDTLPRTSSSLSPPDGKNSICEMSQVFRSYPLRCYVAMTVSEKE